MTVGHTEGTQLQQQISKRGLTIALALAIICAVTNLVLRTAVQLKKKSSDAIPEHQRQQRAPGIENHAVERASTYGDQCPKPEQGINNSVTSVILPFGIYVLFALVFLFGIFMAFQMVDKNNYFHMAPTNVAIFTMSFLLPGTLIVSDKKIKSFVKKRIQQNLQQCLSPKLFSNQIAPA